MFHKCVLLCVAFLTIGCGSRGHQEILESRLRIQEEELGKLRTQLDQQQKELQYAQRENELLNQQLSTQTPLDNYTAERSHLEQIKIDPLYSGLVAGPQGASCVVMLTPVDGFSNAIKVPGDILLEWFDPDSDPQSTPPLDRWSLDASSSLKFWQDGVLKSGFLIQMQPNITDFQQKPVRLQATLTTGPNEKFKTSVILNNNTTSNSLSHRDQPRDVQQVSYKPAPPPVLQRLSTQTQRVDSIVPEAQFWKKPIPPSANSDLTPKVHRPSENPPTVTSDIWTDTNMPVYR